MHVTAIASVCALLATSSFVSAAFILPDFRGTANSEYSEWDVFTGANSAANYPDVAAPHSPGNNPDNPTLTNTGASAILTGSNIYSFSGVITLSLSDTTPYELGTVVYQFQTQGSELDYSSLQLHYGSESLAPTTTQFLSYVAGTEGVAVQYAAQWDLSGLSITSYTITVSAEGAHASFQAAALDTSNTFTPVVVPEPGMAIFGLASLGLVLRRRKTL